MVDWEPPENYGVICTVNRQYIYLSMDVLGAVGIQLDRRRSIDSADEPEFLECVDITGSEVRIRFSQIECVYDSTPEIRERDRLMHEHFKAGRPYDD